MWSAIVSQHTSSCFGNYTVLFLALFFCLSIFFLCFDIVFLFPSRRSESGRGGCNAYRALKNWSTSKSHSIEKLQHFDDRSWLDYIRRNLRGKRKKNTEKKERRHSRKNESLSFSHRFQLSTLECTHNSNGEPLHEIQYAMAAWFSQSCSPYSMFSIFHLFLSRLLLLYREFAYATLLYPRSQNE